MGWREVIPTKLFHLLSKTRWVWEHRKHTQSMGTQKHVQSTFNHTQCTRTKKYRHCTGTQKHIQSTFNIETHKVHLNTETQSSEHKNKHTVCEHRNTTKCGNSETHKNYMLTQEQPKPRHILDQHNFGVKT